MKYILLQFSKQVITTLVMALFPRKYRSLLYKLVVIIPVLWLTVMLIAHNSNSGSGGGSASGPGGGVPGDVQAGPHRKVLDGEASGLRNTGAVGQIEKSKVDPFQDGRKKVLPSPTEKSADVDIRYVWSVC